MTSTPMTEAMASRIVDFQRNAAFAAFLSVIVVYMGLLMIGDLRSTLIPLVWASFFALPLQRAVEYLNLLEIRAMSWLLSCFRDAPNDKPIPFRHVVGQNRLVVDATPANKMMLQKVQNPCVGLTCCPRSASSEIRSQPRGKLSQALLSCCRRRVRVLEVKATGEQPLPDTNRLLEHQEYYLGDLSHSEDGAVLHLKLYLDHGDTRYPAIVDIAPAGDEAEMEITGTMEVDKTSVFSWSLAILCVLCFVAISLLLLGSLIYWGANSFQKHIDLYITGVQEFIDTIRRATDRFIPDDTWNQISKNLVDYLEVHLPAMVAEVLSGMSGVLLQSVFFLIYLLFWLCEPIPVTNAVTQVFKTYLLLKSFVCFLFATMMSLILAFLGCKIWPLFFILTFALNYIPEIGPILVGIISVPAVLFDGSVADFNQRAWNTVVLIILALAAKFITGNIIEVQMYVSRGGEFMRMHPVVLMAMMFIFGEILGMTGMFLAVPIVAATKYFIVSSNMPPMIKHPLLCLIEGDNMAPHRNFVDNLLTAKALKTTRSPSNSQDTSEDMSMMLLPGRHTTEQAQQ